MTPPSPASTEDLFDEIASLLEPGQREHFYRCMLYFKHLRPDDELLRLVEAIGFLALLIRGAPHAVAVERAQLSQLLETSVATIQAAGEAGQVYQRQLDERLTRLPSDIAEGISPEAISRAIAESLRQQFVQSGLPATVDALTALSRQVTEATGPLQRAAGELNASTGIADQARRAIDQVQISVANATASAERAVAELTHQVRVEWTRALYVVCSAAWLFGVAGGVAFEGWRSTGIQVEPQPIAIPTTGTEPSSSAAPTPKKPTPAPARDRHREAHTQTPHGEGAEAAHGTVMEQRSNSDGTATSVGETKP
jgi:hypothetical protein